MTNVKDFTYEDLTWLEEIKPGTLIKVPTHRNIRKPVYGYYLGPMKDKISSATVNFFDVENSEFSFIGDFDCHSGSVTPKTLKVKPYPTKGKTPYNIEITISKE